MPLYEYHCEPCEGRFEVLRSMAKGNDPAVCPACGGEGRRVLSVFAAVSVGGGAQGAPMTIPGAGGACCGGGGCGCH